MNPVAGGWTSHKIKGDTEYESQKRAALAQSGPNDFIQGVQQAYLEGSSQPIADSRTKYGNVNIMPSDILQGLNSNFGQVDNPGNVPRNDRKQIVNTTGNVGLQVSSTKLPHSDPAEFETSALDRRLQLMAKGGMNNLNNVSNLYY